MGEEGKERNRSFRIIVEEKGHKCLWGEGTFLRHGRDLNLMWPGIDGECRLEERLGSARIKSNVRAGRFKGGGGVKAHWGYWKEQGAFMRGAWKTRHIMKVWFMGTQVCGSEAEILNPDWGGGRKSRRSGSMSRLG